MRRPLRRRSLSSRRGDSRLEPRVIELREALTEASNSGNYGYTTWTFFPAATDTDLAETMERVWSGEMTAQEYLEGMQASFDEEGRTERSRHCQNASRRGTGGASRSPAVHGSR